MEIKKKTIKSVTVEFTTKEFEAFVQLMKLRTGVKDYKGGK